MTAQEKNEILRIIIKEIRSSGFLSLSHLGGVLERNGFSRNIHGSNGLKKWLQLNFPEVEIVERNGKEILSVNNIE